MHRRKFIVYISSILKLTTRALAYGLARMKIDGQLPQWDIPEQMAESTLLQAIDLFIRALEVPANRKTRK